MNLGSMGEIPPSTPVSRGFSDLTASAASFVISAYIVHSGSSSKSQCDLLLGSFQNITASTIVPPHGRINGARPVRHRLAPTDKNFLFGMAQDFESRASQHRFSASSIGYPPVRRIAAVSLLVKKHSRKGGLFEYFLLPEIVFDKLFRFVGSPEHRLKNQQVPGDVFVNQIEGKKRMPQMVKDSHEDHEIKLLAQLGDVVHRQFSELDVEASHLSGEARLRQIRLVEIDSDHAIRAPALHLHRIESRIASDIQNRFPLETLRYRVSELPPLHVRVVTEKVIGRGRHAVEIQVMKPFPKTAHPLLDFFA